MDLCQPGKPRTKGKVEKAVKYVRSNFLQRKHDPSLEDWNRDALQWLQYVANAKPNSTTGVAPDVRFVDEQKSLLPILRIAPYAVTKYDKRVVYNGYSK